MSLAGDRGSGQLGEPRESLLGQEQDQQAAEFGLFEEAESAEYPGTKNDFVRASLPTEVQECIYSLLSSLPCLFLSPSLVLQSNRITVLEGLDELVSLEELYISDNGIQEIRGLDSLVG